MIGTRSPERTARLEVLGLDHLYLSVRDLEITARTAAREEMASRWHEMDSFLDPLRRLGERE